MFCASALAPPGTPIGSSVAVVSANGFCFSPREIQTCAVGRSISRDCLSTTRDEIRLLPWPLWLVRGMIAAPPPGGPQRASIVPAHPALVVAPEVVVPPPLEQHPPQAVSP